MNSLGVVINPPCGWAPPQGLTDHLGSAYYTWAGANLLQDATEHAWYDYGGSWGDSPRDFRGKSDFGDFGPMGPGQTRSTDAAVVPPGWS
jgi:hypothetical protein